VLYLADGAAGAYRAALARYLELAELLVSSRGEAAEGEDGRRLLEEYERLGAFLHGS
jgi:hypothetical protein